ncbi:hypothetical protein SAMN06265371_101412 [Lutibacter agarilyticus]|uniref:Uncharacterized protein n=1 Tax=Lutibacter agarilyticus TaxID=1109740 RepID=A0A238VGS0_9FLAO|nr:hypothetical protein SAMN06265371_101412 [Lutibacter agarilyticus]
MIFLGMPRVLVYVDLSRMVYNVDVRVVRDNSLCLTVYIL